MKVSDILNKKVFGDYTVINRTEDHITEKGFHVPRYNCVCKCGKEDILSGRTLEKNPKCKHIDETIGKQFGCLSVLRRNDIHNNKTGYNIKAYDCKCVCGKIIQVRSSNLPRTNSCGCQWKHDYIGKRFGRLIVLEKAERSFSTSGQSRTMWKCRCDCGNEVVVDDSGLTTGSTQSCGCLQRELQSKKMKKYNEYDLSGEYGIGYTNNCNEEGINYFYFDLEDYDKIKNYCWCFNNTGYIQAQTTLS